MWQIIGKNELKWILKGIMYKFCHEGRKRHLRRPHFSKGLTKLAILPDYKHPGMLCLALPAGSKLQKSDFQSEFSSSKIIRISLIFFSLKNNKLGAHFFVTSTFKLLKMVKSGRDAYNLGLWLIL